MSNDGFQDFGNMSILPNTVNHVDRDGQNEKVRQDFQNCVLPASRVYEGSCWKPMTIEEILGDDGVLSYAASPFLYGFRFIKRSLFRKRYTFHSIRNVVSGTVAPSSVPQLQRAFASVIQTMYECTEVLSTSLTSDDIDADALLDAETKLTLCAKSLEDLASIKNSLVVIMGMQPSLLHILCTNFPVAHAEFTRRFPRVQHALIKLIVKNCNTHDYFLATSEWLSATKSHQVAESMTSKHAQLQLHTICNCLRNGIKWKQTRKLVCTWLAALLSRIDENLLVQLAKRKEWIELHRVFISTLLEEEVDECLQDVARRLGVFSNEHEKNIAQILSTVLEKIGKVGMESGKKIRGRVDSSLFIRCSVSTNSWNLLESRQARIMASNFTSADFSLLSDFLLKGVAPSLSLNPEEDIAWLFDTINIIYNNQNEKSAPKDVSKCIQKWRWALAQMALHCVENKMKTTLGKATETFNAIGSEIQRLGKVALGVVEDRRSVQSQFERMKSPKRNQRDEEEGYGKTRELTDEQEWWRVRCLLEFFEIFDKIMFNAITGAHFPLATVSQPARQFFHANISSCNEWLTRTYPYAMIVAFHAGYYAQVIRFGSSALIDLEKKQQKAEQVSKDNTVAPPSSNALATIMLIARAMAELSASQATKGLQTWTTKTFKIDAFWLTGPIEMASARYESALKHLIYALRHDDITETLKVHLRTMILDVLNRLRLPLLFDPLKCPAELSIWREADKLNPSPDGFDADALSKLTQLCSFTKVEHFSSSSTCWDINNHLFSTEAHLMQTLRRTEVLEMKDRLSEFGHLVLLTDSGHRIHGKIAVLEKILTALAAKMNKKFPESDIVNIELDPTFLEHSNSDVGERFYHARKLSFWTERLEAHQTHELPAILARKTGNYLLAEELVKKMGYVAPSSSAAKRFLTCSLEKSKMHWEPNNVVEMANAWSLSFIALEQALLVENVRQQQLMFVNNGGYINGVAHSPFNNVINGTLSPLGQFSRIPIEDCSLEISKTALKLAQWIGSNAEITNSLNMEVFHTSLWNQMESAVRSFGGDYSKFLLGLAAQVSPTMAKAHLKLANWFYDAARNTYTLAGKENFINRYRAFMENVPNEAFDKLWDLLFTAGSMVELNDSVNSIVDPSTAAFFLGNGSKYIETWNQHYQNKVNLLSGCVNGYFSFISQLGSRDQRSMGTVSSTLRVLGLLADYPEAVSPLIQTGFTQTNESLWRDILPQLFSRLSHPNRLVRDSIVSLIAKICMSAPHSVVFQIVSGASTSIVEDGDDIVVSEELEEYEVVKQEKTLMFECCQQLKLILQGMYPTLVTDVQLFVNELQKISLLNEEKWTFVLSNLDHEMSKRLDQIKKETEKTTSSTHLSPSEKADIITEKSQLITSSVYRILHDLYDRSCLQVASTVNEELFTEEYGLELKRAFEQSKNSSKNPEKAWTPFRQFLSLLIQKNVRRGAQVLNIQEISTALATMSDTSIPLPGQEDSDYEGVVTISRVGATAQILPTKTRPKKMMFVGSDGKEQIFLFKGQEDLHLDERVMQLLQICNLLLRRSSKRSWPDYTARHYAVTPLGSRSGLIQWVGGATPLFFLYRKWQQRQAQIQHSIEKKNGTISAAPEIERPTELYQKTLRAAFLKNKVEPEIIADRTRWPQNVMKEVFHSLTKETPKDLLSRELWMKAGTSDTWWRVVCRFARSSAVMSIIGAILGLGDRHLDNLLVNIDKGEIVHIDYNICFDKGKSLRVPETVPFRLTQNVAHAMGPTNVEGVFRESCYHVLENLRTNKEVLLTILEAFLYDPLVDWASLDHLTTSSAAVSVAVVLAVYGNDSRIQDAKPIARKMFAVRKKEYSELWLSNYANISEVLNALKTTVTKIINGGSAWENPEQLEQQKVEDKKRLQVVLSEEQQMMRHFRPLIKALATCDERFAVYLKNYKEFFHHPVMKVFHLLDSNELPDLKICLEKLEVVQQNVHRIYHDVLSIDAKESAGDSGDEKFGEKRSSPPGLDRLAKSEQQEQNAYAKNAVKRVRSRLEGSTEENTTLSVEEQADYFIGQATSSTKLSQMYEGWTAWV